MIDPRRAEAFLHCGRLALVGVSDDPKNFGGAIRRALIEQGIEVVAVNPNAEVVGGEPCYPALSDVPGAVDGVVIMISGAAVLDVIRAAAVRAVPRVWLFKGIGGPGAASPEAVALAEELGIEVIAGACPLMFLEPVGAGHRFHRLLRRANGSVGKAA